MSVNVDGRSTIRAPPKSGVLRKVVIVGDWDGFIFRCVSGLNNLTCFDVKR